MDNKQHFNPEAKNQAMFAGIFSVPSPVEKTPMLGWDALEPLQVVAVRRDTNG